MQKLAIIDHSMRLHVTDVEGTDVLSVDASGGGQTWPVWSPAGDRLAFSRVSSGNNGHGRIELYYSALDGAGAVQVYRNERGTDAIARRTPHYAVWSPDGGRLAFIAQTSDGTLTLFGHEIDGDGSPEPVLKGRPMFGSWSSDSRYLLAHVGADHFLVDWQEGGAFHKVPASSRLYSSPSWSPVEGRMALLREGGDDRQALIVGDTDGGTARAMTEFIGAGAFSWAPHGRSLALARDLDSQTRSYSGLWVLEADGQDEMQVTEDPILCFYWSPDGSRVACVTPSQDIAGWTRWTVLDLSSGVNRPRVDFLPTEEQLNIIMFFDQYAQSHSPWSPDGRMLVFAGTTSRGRESTGLPRGEESSVFVMDADGDGPPRPVARGTLGAWARDSGGG